MNDSPVVTMSEDGHATMVWNGPDPTLVARPVLENMVAEHNDLVDLRAQIKRLADFIVAEMPGEPSQDGGAVDCAIRLLAASK